MAGAPRRASAGPHRVRALIRLLQPGDVAPDFTLAGSDGARHELRRLLAESHVLLVFYPGNDTPG